MTAPADGAGPVVVASLGSVDRRDDGVGPAVVDGVAARVPAARAVGPLADPLDLLGVWDGARLAVVVDAVRSGEVPGTVRQVELAGGIPVAGEWSGGRDRLTGTTSTHGIGLSGVLRLARAVGRAPERVVVVGIEGERFSHGDWLSPAVAAAVPEAVRLVVELVEEVGRCA